ncbi:VOC family protein [Nocardia sp. NEAU-G5]|uniref:VOC family protein n=1 Tax=Nocardia albiluteola TaxID=2842303 RepID=A0ABS6AZT5_9NOCA|nr:VOC family protein [Nocardia albiluteola]MBU3063383.1 VOC family protein [Nocardia albiluteola]
MTETTQTSTSATTTETARQPGGTVVWPAFRYRDAVAAIDFLERAFGFVQRVRYPESGPVVDHAELAFPRGGGIMLGSVREDSVLAGLPPGTGSVYIVIDDPDALYERAKAAGATITRELCDQDYGSREFSCRDPEGVHWSFGTYAGAPA